MLDNNSLLGHYRVKMALDALGYRYGHTTVWQMVALYKQAHLPSPREPRRPNPDQRPQQATTPHQVWFADLRYLSRSMGAGSTASSSSMAIAGRSGSPLLRSAEFRAAGPGLPAGHCPTGAPETVVSDHGAVFVALALSPPLAIQWAPITKGHPWQNLAEGGFWSNADVDAYVAGCTDREAVYRQHTQFVQDYQFWGHKAHKPKDAQGRLYYVSPEVILANTKGRLIDAGRLRRIFRLRQLTRQVRQHGQVRLHNFGLVDGSSGARPSRS